MNVYHTFEENNGFDLNKIDFNRGLFTIKAWWVGRPEYSQYTKWNPNEFGDKVVELDIDEHAKTYEASHQVDLLEHLFGKENPKIKILVYKYEHGDFDRDDWRIIDGLIGKTLKKKGYKIIHYKHDEMYGDTWAIIDPSAIKSVHYEND